MTVTKYYLNNWSPDWTPSSLKGSWGYIAPAVLNGYNKKLGTSKLGATISGAAVSGNGSTSSLANAIFITPAFATKTLISWNSGVIGAKESGTPMDAYLWAHCYVTVGDTSSVRGTIINYQRIYASELSTTAYGWTATPTSTSAVTAEIGDRIVLELGVAHVANSTRTATVYFGGENAVDLAPSASATIYPGWVAFDLNEVEKNLAINDIAVADVIDGNLLLGGIATRDTWYTTLRATQQLVNDEITVSSSIDSCNVTMNHILAVQDITIPNIFDSCEVTVFASATDTWYTLLKEASATLTTNDIAISDILDNIDLEQHFLYTVNATVAQPLVINDSTIQPIFDSCDVVLGQLGVNDSTVQSVLDNVSLTVTHNLAVADLIEKTEMDSCWVTESPASVTDIIVETVIDNIVLVQDYNFIVNDLIGQPVFDNCDVSKDDKTLIFNEIDIIFSIDNIDLVQKHVFVLNDITIQSYMDNVRLSGFWFEDSQASPTWQDYDKSTVSWDKE